MPSMSLGVVLTPYGHTPGYPPYGISTTRAGATQWREPFDPQWYSRGETGYYYDTQLGASKRSWWSRAKAKMGLGNFPTDFEMARMRGYLPVESGWVTTAQGYQSGGWSPPHGRYPGFPAALNPPLAPLNGLGALGVVPADPPTVADVMLEMQQHNDRILTLTVISTTAVAISSLLGLFRTLKLIKENK